MVRGQVERQHTAERVANQHDPAQPERIEQTDHVRGVFGHGVVGSRRCRVETGRGPIALAASAQIDGNVPEPRAQPGADQILVDGAVAESPGSNTKAGSPPG